MLLVPVDAAFSFRKQPLNPTIVVLGHNSSRVTLAWDYTAGGEQIGTMFIKRLNNSKSATVATRFSPASKGEIIDAFNKDGHFGFEDPATLVINQVTAKDEFVYRCVVLTDKNHDGHKSDINLKVYSKSYDILIFGKIFSISTVFLVDQEL